MTTKQIKALALTGIITFSICAIVTLIMTLFLYFEVIGSDMVSKVLYALFVGILLIFSFICARVVATRGFLVGLGIGIGIVSLSLLYRLIGVESGIDMTFVIRSAITILVAVSGAVVGVNTVKR